MAKIYSIKNILHRLQTTRINSLLFICLLVLFSSCKTKKQVLQFSNIRPMRAVKLYDQTQLNQIQFKTLSLKFSANYQKGGESQSFGGTIRIINDSLIWVSIVPALGIEAARLLITKDSIKLINRMKSSYYVGNYSFLRNMLSLEIDYEMLQCLLANEFFIYSKNPEMEENIRGFKSSDDSSGYVIRSLKERKVNRKLKKNKLNDLILQEIHILPEIYKISRMFINDFENQKSLDVSYSNFEKEDSLLFPKIVDCKIKNINDEINLNMEFTKITINKILEYPFSIPEKYTKTIE